MTGGDAMPLSFEANPERTVILPFDFSAPATKALALARGLVVDPEQLYLVHVIPPLEAASPGFLNAVVDLESLQTRVEEQLDEAITAAKIGEVSRRVRVGDPATEIVEVAGEVDADLIVIPSHGKTGLARWMIGSVAERVVRHTRCPVLVLPINQSVP